MKVEITLNLWNCLAIIFAGLLVIGATRIIINFLDSLLHKIYNSASEKIDIFCDTVNKKIKEETNYKKKTTIGFVDRSSCEEK